MENIFNLQNDFIQISVNEIGAELCAIKSLSESKNYMWNANPEIWAGYSPVLFPIVGALKNDSYVFENKAYTLPRHGFIRKNANIKLLDSTENSLLFQLKNNAETLKVYPFYFEINMRYTIEGSKISISNEVINTGKKPMYFSLGAHPAFKCPVDSYEQYSDYYLEFEQPETAYTYEITESGLMGDKTDLILNNSNTIELHHGLFNKGALVFKDIKSKKISLVSKQSGKKIEVSFPGFPYLGIWAKPNADYVCIEPWHGIADDKNTDQNFTGKEGLICLNDNDSFESSYHIEVF